jgi:hypothetical protein
MKKSILLSLILLAILAGCTFRAHYVQTGARAYEQSDPDKVLIFSGEPGKPYNTIGPIAINSPGETETAREKLQDLAASLGADAVINVKFDLVDAGGRRTGLYGVAVKFK